MLSNDKKGFTKDNLDMYFKELAKEFRKPSENEGIKGCAQHTVADSRNDKQKHMIIIIKRIG